MSGPQSMQKSRCDGYDGLIATPRSQQRAFPRDFESLAQFLMGVISGTVPHRNDWPVDHMQCMIIASFRATAILALLRPIRFVSRTPHALSVLQRCVRVSNTPAASHR
jgi:hypothetical protein